MSACPPGSRWQGRWTILSKSARAMDRRGLPACTVPLQNRGSRRGLLTHPWVASGARKRTREGDQHFIWAGPKGPFPGPEMKPHSGRFRCVCSGCRVSRCSARSCEAGPGRNTYQGTVGLSSAPPSPGQRGVRGRRSPRLWYPVLSGVGGAVLRGLGGLARRYGSIRACGGALGGLGACWALNW